MNKKPAGKIALNLGGLKLGSSSSGASTSSEVMGFGTFGTKNAASNVKQKEETEVDLVAERR